MTKFNLLDKFVLRDPRTKIEQEVLITCITLNPTPIYPEDKIIYTFSNLQTCNEPTLIEQIEKGLIKANPSNIYNMFERG
jgi:hypothetical protein